MNGRQDDKLSQEMREERISMLSNGVKNFVLKEEHYIISILCIFFGIGSWIMVNALYTQLPILVQVLPEGLSLPTFITAVIQLGNIGPIVYAIFRNKTFFIKDSTLISCLLLLGSLTMLFMAFTYELKNWINGSYHSIFLLVGTFIISIIGCVSSVLFIPFMNRLPEKYLTSFFLGEGFSGLLPSLLSTVQGIEQQCVNKTTGETIISAPLFDTKIYFCIISLIMFISCLSYFYLHRHYCPNESISRRDNEDDSGESRVSNRVYVYVLLLQVIINFFSNGILTSFKSYATVPYGYDTYHWAINLSQLSSIFMYYVSYFLPTTSLVALSISFVVTLFCILFEVEAALLSPAPPLYGTVTGSIIIVAVCTACSALISYVKLSNAAVLRMRGKSALFFYGVVTQIGSALGASCSFIIVTYTSLLQASSEKEYCT